MRPLGFNRLFNTQFTNFICYYSRFGRGNIGFIGQPINVSAKNVPILSTILLVFTAIILLLGHYRFLVFCLKYVVSVLFVAVLIAFGAALYKGMPSPAIDFMAPSFLEPKNIVLMVNGYVGWLDAYSSRSLFLA